MQQTITDDRELLPHFTPLLGMELRKRLKTRILENWVVLHDEDEDNFAERMAFDIVCRMYRTQLKEARAVISFSDAVLGFNQPQMEQQGKLLPGRAAEKLKGMFRRRTQESE